MSVMGGLGNMASLMKPAADTAQKAVKANNVKKVKLSVKLKVKKDGGSESK
jgi:hypothetical protein